jgi:hypothetical protein
VKNRRRNHRRRLQRASAWLASKLRRSRAKADADNDAPKNAVTTEARHAIRMSLRMKTADHFWWTYFHEVAYIILHRGCNFAYDQNGDGDGLKKKAHRWAQEILAGRGRFEFLCQEPLPSL